MSIDKLIGYALQAVKDEEQKKYEEERKAWKEAKPLGDFRVEVTAGSLISPAQKQADHHKGRAEYYTKELEKAEIELREKGVSVQVWDGVTNQVIPFAPGSIASGAIASGQIGSFNLCSGSLGSYSMGSQTTNASQIQFRPQIEQRYLDAVNFAKKKMIEHGEEAVKFEKWARALALMPNKKIELTVEQVHWFRLEN